MQDNADVKPPKKLKDEPEPDVVQKESKETEPVNTEEIGRLPPKPPLWRSTRVTKGKAQLKEGMSKLKSLHKMKWDNYFIEFESRVECSAVEEFFRLSNSLSSSDSSAEDDKIYKP